MTPDRRQHIIKMLGTVKCLDELSGFTDGLKRNGEHADSEVMVAIEARKKVLQSRR